MAVSALRGMVSVGDTESWLGKEKIEEKKKKKKNPGWP